MNKAILPIALAAIAIVGANTASASFRADCKYSEYLQSKLEIGVAKRSDIKALQEVIGTTPDGAFGPKSFNALAKHNDYCEAILSGEPVEHTGVTKLTTADLENKKSLLTRHQFTVLHGDTNNVHNAYMGAVDYLRKNDFDDTWLVDVAISYSWPKSGKWTHEFVFKNEQGAIKLRVSVDWLMGEVKGTEVVYNRIPGALPVRQPR